MHQDYCKFYYIIRKQNRDVKLTIYEDMSHGFLNFNTIKGMKETGICVDDGVIFLNELINM